ncbi:MAG: hypothetical protein AVDCRST_MAG15-596, partial [uncultured Rubellimicrobium sp.]
ATPRPAPDLAHCPWPARLVRGAARSLGADLRQGLGGVRGGAPDGRGAPPDSCGGDADAAAPDRRHAAAGGVGAAGHRRVSSFAQSHLPRHGADPARLDPPPRRAARAAAPFRLRL